MAENQQSAFQARMSPLPETYTDQQAFADAIAAGLVLEPINPPKAEDGQPGAAGTQVTITKTTIALEEDSTFQDMGVPLEGANVQLVNTGGLSEIPSTMWITAIRGNVVFFNIGAPTANYKVVVSTITLSNPT